MRVRGKLLHYLGCTFMHVYTEVIAIKSKITEISVVKNVRIEQRKPIADDLLREREQMESKKGFMLARSKQQLLTPSSIRAFILPDFPFNIFIVCISI